jgi:hypothetical protein
MVRNTKYKLSNKGRNTLWNIWPFASQQLGKHVPKRYMVTMKLDVFPWQRTHKQQSKTI